MMAEKKKKHSLDSSPTGGEVNKRLKFISSTTTSSEDSSTYSPNSPSSHYTPNYGSQSALMGGTGGISISDQYSTASQSSTGGDLYQHQQFQQHGDQQQQQQQQQQPQHIDGTSASSQYVYTTSSNVASQDDPFSALPSFPMDAFSAAASTDGLVGPYPQQNSHHQQHHHGSGSGYMVAGDQNGGYEHRNFAGFSNGEVEAAGNLYYGTNANYAPRADDLKPDDGAYMPTNGYARIDPVENNGVYQNFPNYLSL